MMVVALSCGMVTAEAKLTYFPTLSDWLPGGIAATGLDSGTRPTLNSWQTIEVCNLAHGDLRSQCNHLIRFLTEVSGFVL